MTSNGPLDDRDPQHHLRRLDQVLVESPVYFFTTNVENSSVTLTDSRCIQILLSELKSVRDRHGWGIGMYVIMPDHIHFFAAPSQKAVPLSRLMQAWKEWTSKRISRTLGLKPPIWQREFFDRLLRSWESHEEKSRYIRENPVKAGLVRKAEDWPHQGVIERLQFLE